MKSYSREVFEMAEAELDRRRKSAEEENQRRKAEIYSAAPEVAVLESSLAATGARLMKLAAEGKENISELIKDIRNQNLQTQKAIYAILQELKGDEKYLDVPYTCTLCNDTGYSEGSRCDCMKKLLDKYASDELNAKSSIKLHDFTEFSPDYYESADVKEKMLSIFNYCRDYARNFNEGSQSLLLIGKTGLGKTFLSSCIAKYLLEEGRAVAFGSVSDFIRDAENEQFGRSGGNTLRVLADAELLILDDLGSEFHTSFTEFAIYDMINSRINLEKPTIISTNMSIKELDEKYNERIISRITGNFVPLIFHGQDIRQIKRQRREF